MNTTPLDPNDTLGLTPSQLPRHIAIIMDGNGRWAENQGIERIRGHERGARRVREIVTHCARLGIEALTLYSFSLENWKRPRAEVDFLMALYVDYLIAERETIMGNNVRFRHVGQRDGLPASVLAEMDMTVEMSRENSGLTLCLALNYGSRQEIVEAARSLAHAVQDGRMQPEDIDQQAFANALHTSGVPDPDLLIRTAGEYRVSNFLLWQISYAEIYVCRTCWPDFSNAHLDDAIKDFASRQRRFGSVPVHAPSK